MFEVALRLNKAQTASIDNKQGFYDVEDQACVMRDRSSEFGLRDRAPEYSIMQESSVFSWCGERPDGAGSCGVGCWCYKFIWRLCTPARMFKWLSVSLHCILQTAINDGVTSMIWYTELLVGYVALGRSQEWGRRLSKEKKLYPKKTILPKCCPL